MSVKAKFRYLFIAVSIAAVIFTTCDAPLGMGDPIDWEPPVLTIDPVPTPLYVRKGTVLTGTVTDNSAVDRVIIIDTATGRELVPVQKTGDAWKIEFQFTEEDNGKKIVARIMAYDKAGNTGESAIVTITLYIDIRPPLIDNMDIKRTDSRLANIEPYAALKGLETSDPRGEKKANLYRYQNGWFYINGIIAEDETKIEILSLDIYDTTAINDVLLTLQLDNGYSNNFPRWTVKEENIIEAGVAKFGPTYKTNYYNNGARYYYRVVVKARDKSGNENAPPVIEEDEGYFCLFANSDKPKGIIDTLVGSIVSRGTPLPVDIYDDDSLLWAYAGLFTKEQWAGSKPIASSVFIPAGTDDAQKFTWLKDRLTSGGAVYNWRYDRYQSQPAQITSKDLIEEQIKGRKIDETLIYVPTGNSEEDFGDFVLFSIVADKKLNPHDGNGPEWTNRDGWEGRIEPVQVIDENAPLIVFDTNKGSPEENTFPEKLFNVSPDPEEKYFNLIGYTLRENSSNKNKVEKFRMAWIPYGIQDGADSHIKAVQEALKASDYPAGFAAAALDGVQYWEFKETPGTGDGQFKDEGNEPIDTSIYKRQSFTKRFSVMGDADDLKPGTRNFTYNGKLENETKTFVFYAIDNMGHEVFRQLRLLGFKTQPEITVYDITNSILTEDMPLYSTANFLPDPNADGNIIQSTGAPSSAYYSKLNTYNQLSNVYSRLKGVGFNENDKSIPFQIYPRGTIVKYSVSAAKEGKIGIEKITMTDITFTTQYAVGSAYNTTDKTLTFCEYYPDVTSRTFLFEATDRLGNVARIQRTIAVTNAAKLENITTTEQSGTYGIDKVIKLRANFSSQIYINNGVRPKLNVRYKNASGGVVNQAIDCNTPLPNVNTPSLYLEFDFKVPVGATGALETPFGNIYSGASPDYSKRAIELNGSEIFDYSRKDRAFIPGYKIDTIDMPNWETVKNSLQDKKAINLDGIRPQLDAVAWSGKTAYSTNNYYFKTGETIELALTTNTAGKDIRVLGAPTIQYYIRDTGNTERGPYNANFKYLKPGTTNKTLIFSLTVDSTSCPYDGALVKASLKTDANNNIVDNVGNSIEAGVIRLVELMPSSLSFFIKKSISNAPPAALNGAAFNTASDTFNAPPNLTITPSTSLGPFSIEWEDTMQYSLNGGLSWSAYTAPVPIPIGTFKLQARYKDRAGNEGPVNSKDIVVNDTFPKLVSVTVKQSNGWYPASGNNLTFNLNFEDSVRVNAAVDVKITLKNRSASTDASGEITLQTTTPTSTTNWITSVEFNWANINTSLKEMRDGLYVSSVTLTGLSDKFGNSGKDGTASFTSANASGNTNPAITISTSPTYTCPNLPYTNANASVKVDNVPPSVTARSPATNNTPSGTNSITELTITFSEPVMKGSGTITVRPRGNYAIPPVFEDQGYYLGTNGERYSTEGANRTFIPGFYDVYNNSALTATERGYLLEGTSMSSHTLNTRTGQSKGPYKKTTQGLVDGRGYTGNYSGTNIINGANSPDTATGYMVPDLSTKWVLDYQYQIASTTSATVNNIRAALNKAKFRWQEIDVSNSSVTIGTGASANTATIKLNEPLLKGLEWDVYYPKGTFTDMAGNEALLSDNATYYFTTPGVQPPVIRVNRRSFDARNSNWSSATNRTYQAPPNTTNWSNAGTSITDNGLAADTGWGIEDFNAVHYRVESESPGVTMTVGTSKGAANASGGRSAKGAWTGTVSDANAGATSVNSMNWDAGASNTAGTWVLNNIIRRSRDNANQTYTVVTRNGISESRTSTTSDDANRKLRMFRSYNRDANSTDLSNITLTTQTNGYQGVLTFDALEANKSYIAAQATKNGASAKGYEAIYRTVIALNFSSSKGNNFLLIEGSNIKNGMPSVAGFPVRDAEETGDNRFIKVFYDNSGSATARTRFYWVSTEIVCEWYFLYWGGGGSHQNVGEVNNYLTVGYGDLTYAYDLGTY